MYIYTNTHGMKDIGGIRELNLLLPEKEVNTYQKRSTRQAFIEHLQCSSYYARPCWCIKRRGKKESSR